MKIIFMFLALAIMAILVGCGITKTTHDIKYVAVADKDLIHVHYKQQDATYTQITSCNRFVYQFKASGPQELYMYVYGEKLIEGWIYVDGVEKAHVRGFGLPQALIARFGLEV